MGDSTEKIRIPPRGTRAGGMAWMAKLTKVGKVFMDMQVSRYRKTAGDTAPVMMGFPVVLLTTLGAKTGLERTNVLGGFADGDDSWLIVASKSGAATHPAWFVNLAKNPDQVWLEVGKRKFRAHVESLQGSEREAALARVAKVARRYAEYQAKTDREIPVLRLTPAR
ncbi:MAG TPA: nitroreductase/quinone reductase family protein [Candidatus Dormibacteraeota bacterium]|nr:nitroreductase/quinone reductase family protein [Candidatus Dormibacteraeota bacterium]